MSQNQPINLIRVFEAAGRTVSFREAATELGISPSAVSHSVRKLEDYLGAPLFTRKGRNVYLNPTGEELMRHVGEGLERIRYGFELVSSRGPGLLRLHCAPSLATQWLAPRLTGLLREAPGLDVRLSADTNYTRFEIDEFDIDIVYGLTAKSGFAVIPFGQEIVTPLCSPELASQIKRPEDLYQQRRLESDNKQVRWSEWFLANHLEAPRPNGSRFDRSYLAIMSAVNGLGVCLESTLLAEREILSGALVAPLVESAENIKYTGHHIVFPRTSARRRVVRLFTGWLARERGLEDVDFSQF
jgi:LysR family transcriptional regulator, glycine cleavage system transcriptional activator